MVVVCCVVLCCVVVWCSIKLVPQARRLGEFWCAPTVLHVLRLFDSLREMEQNNTQ